MNEDVDEQKLEELKLILKQISKDNKDLSKLIQFEAENQFIFYYSELFTNSDIGMEEISIIEDRFGDYNFQNKEEKYLRKFIKVIKDSDKKSDCIAMFLEGFISEDPKKTHLLLIAFEEIMNLHPHIHFWMICNLISYSHFMDFDSNFIELYKRIIIKISSNELQYTPTMDLIKFMFFFWGEELNSKTEILFNVLYPDLRLILLESDVCEEYLNFLIGVQTCSSGRFNANVEKNRKYFFRWRIRVYL
jgi:hypothetical protein